LFPGDSGVDQLVEIIKVLGTPTREEISAMNSNYTEFKFPQIKACQWKKIFRRTTPEDAIDFIGKMLAYSPDRRMGALEGCGHPFLDELREEGKLLQDGTPLPALFDFTAHELNSPPTLLSKLIPPWLNAESLPAPSVPMDAKKAAHADLPPLSPKYSLASSKKSSDVISAISAKVSTSAPATHYGRK